MKNTHALFSFALAGLFATSMTLRAEDPVPPKPPGSSTIPPAAVTPSTTTPAGGNSANGQRARTPAEILGRLKEELNLTPEQVEKIKPIVAQEIEKLKALKDDTSLQKEQKRDKFIEIVKTSIEEIKPILTPEQLEKLKEVMEKRRAEREKKQ